MQNARIVLSGLRATGRHGASPGEQLQPQEFVIDVDVKSTKNTVQLLNPSSIF